MQCLRNFDKYYILSGQKGAPMKSLLLMTCSFIIGGLINWYRTGWRIFDIDNMLTPNPTLGFISAIGFIMWAAGSMILLFTDPKEILAKKKTLRFSLFSLLFFVTGTVADGGWVLAHEIRYGSDHWYCQGPKHTHLHPNEGVVVRRGIDDPKDKQQFLVVRYSDCGEKWYEMSEPESVYPNRGTRVQVRGACLNQHIISSVSSKQFQEIRF